MNGLDLCQDNFNHYHRNNDSLFIGTESTELESGTAKSQEITLYVIIEQRDITNSCFPIRYPQAQDATVQENSQNSGREDPGTVRSNNALLSKKISC